MTLLLSNMLRHVCSYVEEVIGTVG